MYIFIVAICLVGGYCFGQLTWRWNQWFAKANRVTDHYAATHPDIASGGASAAGDQ